MKYGISKEEQCANSPGGKGKMSERRKSRINSCEKGKRGERAFIKFVCRMAGKDPSYTDKRNYQRIEGGGVDNPDVSISWLPNVFHEIKNCEEFAIPEWLRQLSKDCPVHKIPCLAVKIPLHVRQCRAEKWWVFVPKSRLQQFSAIWEDALREVEIGYVDPFPYPMEAETFHFAGYLRNKHVPGQYIERQGWVGLDMHDLPPLVTLWA
jgi:hypothetical protein